MLEKIIIRAVESKDVHPWLLKRHYARRLCPISYAFGAFDGDNLIGVCTYGTPLSSTLRNGICGEEWADKVLELNRLCCESRKNLASYIVSKSINLLPKPKIVVSYADSGQGHFGIVYQASNFIYTGLSAMFKDPMVKGMEHKHHTTIGDEGRGHKSRIEFLRNKYGSDNVYYIERNRKHRYIYFHSSKTVKKELLKRLKYKIEDYPEGTSKRYDAGGDITGQTYLSI